MQRTLADWLSSEDSRELALSKAYKEGGITMTVLARELGLSVSCVSRLISRAETVKRRLMGDPMTLLTP